MEYSNSQIYFNSIKVRLEQQENTPKITLEEFQFHKGTIRTNQFAAEQAQLNISIP